MAASSGLEYLDLHPFVRTATHDKLLGCIFGGALGDCIGLYTEFLPKTSSEKQYPDRSFSLVEPVTPFATDTHRDKFELGSWTDDTDHALLLILSYLHNKGQIIPVDFARRLKIWVRHGLLALDRLPLGIGRTTSTVVSYPDFAENPESVALKTWMNSSRQGAANGSLMRTHPLGIMCIPKTLDQTFELAAQMSRTTHIDPRCTVSCCAVTGLVRGLLRGEVLVEADMDAVLDQAFLYVHGSDTLRNPGHDEPAAAPISAEQSDALLDRHEYEKHIKAAKYSDLELDDSQKMGYVYKCLGSAVLALRSTMRTAASDAGPRVTIINLFEETIIDLIMQGGDADTNGCVAGALLGAWSGYSRLPSHWVRGIQHQGWLVEKCEALSGQVGVNTEQIQDISNPADTAPDGGRGLFSDKELNDRERGLLEKILLKQKTRRDEKEKELMKTSKKGVGSLLKALKLTT
ncbi:hypothetical protein LTR84_003464 [Exophiala bonariae]|uniref:ADP-ribosylglycohydrolase n=1 Tax=Exophiala bonariae TaxID=1690606 RepID=A0AAV9N7X6_9EURO|nr:hypothetical protein LTR84_003464 [Exophiala bonariae]